LARRTQYLVVGLGRFGGALAEDLIAHGHEVLGVDANPKLVQSYAQKLTHVVEADSTDAEAMRQLGAADFPVAVVAIGTEVEASILTTSVLVDLGVPRIVAKAISEPHGKILSRVGAHRVVFPEHDMGLRVARSLAGRDVIDYMELDPGFVLLETKAPPELVGKTLAEAEVRRRYGLTVVSVKGASKAATYATPETQVEEGDILVIAGETKRVEEFVQLQ
jgi:trk system potassium uptake protein TrkA